MLVVQCWLIPPINHAAADVGADVGVDAVPDHEHDSQHDDADDWCIMDCGGGMSDAGDAWLLRDERLGPSDDGVRTEG